MTEQLKPCPFCGESAQVSRFGVDDDWICVECDANPSCCSVTTLAAYSKNGEIVDQWNTRPIEDAQSARIQELEAHLAEARAKALEWVTFDGSEETLPCEGDTVITHIRNQSFTSCATRSVFEWYWGEAGIPTPIIAGDRWAYLPRHAGEESHE